MRATFALLASIEVHNQVRKLAWDVHQKYQTGIDVSRLPPHISLKQPFEISDVKELEIYMAELAESITPFEATLTHLEAIKATIDDFDTGILWLNVQETQVLRQLHNQVNQELTARIGNVPAAFDGPEYHFHMTVTIGKQPFEIYRNIQNEFSNRILNLQFTVKDLVMFIYDDMMTMDSGYMTYMILPLGKRNG
jgi:2'-5' RNA ligase